MLQKFRFNLHETCGKGFLVNAILKPYIFHLIKGGLLKIIEGQKMILKTGNIV